MCDAKRSGLTLHPLKSAPEVFLWLLLVFASTEQPTVIERGGDKGNPKHVCSKRYQPKKMLQGLGGRRMRGFLPKCLIRLDKNKKTCLLEGRFAQGQMRNLHHCGPFDCSPFESHQAEVEGVVRRGRSTCPVQSCPMTQKESQIINNYSNCF